MVNILRYTAVQDVGRAIPSPDGCAYVADYGGVRDLGRSDPDTGFKNGVDAALVQIPGTGVIGKICRR
jgi:S1-C subfamily serine protease